MPILDDICELVPGPIFREDDETTLYWIRSGKVMYRHYPVQGAHAESFRFYRGSFGKDQKNCYCTTNKFTGGNPSTFRALNFTYATDGVSVWTMGGKVKDTDAESFVVCDDGMLTLRMGTKVGRVPYGYGKDKARVFYYDFDGKPNWVRKATPTSFVSLNDGEFAFDENYVYFRATTLPKANVAQWGRISGKYSKDDRRIYYANRELLEADYASFEVVPTDRDWMQLARDKTHFYNNESVIQMAEFEQLIAECCESAEPHTATDGGA